MNSLLLAQAATTKLNDPANAYNRKWNIFSSSTFNDVLF
jgi:hypothetical protein